MDETAVANAQVSDSNAADGAVNGHTTAAEAAQEDNKFQRAISAWRTIDLTHLVPKLDTTAAEIVTQQKESLVERKDLAQKTKDFRKLDDEAKVVEIKALLKAYQTYIDLVSNQSKSVQSAFLQIYSPLSEAPDPYPLLEASVESLIVADEIVPKLESENKQLTSNNAKLASQLESLEKELEEERKARRGADERTETRVKEVEASWTAVLAEKQNNWEAREKSLEERAENQERLLKELKASYEVSQRMERGEDTQAAAQASAAEIEMMTAELERATLRISEIEARNEQLRVELAQHATQSSNNATVVVEDDPAFLRLRSENSSLIRKIDTAKIEREADKRQLESTVRTLRKEISALEEDSTSLKEKLDKCKDYEDVKRELEVLKSIEFNTGDADDAEAADESDDGTSKGSQELEQLLLARNKKLNDDLTVLRVSYNEMQSRLEMLQEDLSNANIELEKSRTLNAQLEGDLARVQDEPTPSIHPAMSVAGRTQASRYPSASYGSRRGRFSPTSSIISGFDPSSPGLESLRAGEGIGGGSGILPMITAQRDRFKKRIAELDSELAKSHQTVTSLRSEVAALQKDNLNLYEKSRYVSSYSKTPTPMSTTPSAGLNPNPSTVQIPEDSVFDRYRPAYESKISPFAAFRGREQARAMKRMSLPERALLQATKWIFANRFSRNAFGLYFFGLHLMVLLMLLSSGSAAAPDMGVTQLAGSAADSISNAARNVDSLQDVSNLHDVG